MGKNFIPYIKTRTKNTVILFHSRNPFLYATLCIKEALSLPSVFKISFPKCVTGVGIICYARIINLWSHSSRQKNGPSSRGAPQSPFTEKKMPLKNHLHALQSCAQMEGHSRAQWLCGCLNLLVIQSVSKSPLDMHRLVSMIYSKPKVRNLFSTEGCWHMEGRWITGSQRYRHYRIQREKETKLNRQAQGEETETDTQGRGCERVWVEALSCGLLSNTSHHLLDAALAITGSNTVLIWISTPYFV